MSRILRYKQSFLLLLGIWTLVALAFSGVELVASGPENRPVSLWTVVTGNLVRAYAWGALSPLIYWFARRHRIDPRRISWLKVEYNLGFGLFLSLIYPWLTLLIGNAMGAGFSPKVLPWGVLITRQLVYTWYTLISFYLPTFLAIQALLFLRSYREEEAKNAALTAAVSKAQLDALKMQLHPHFLFNSLHAISSLILVEPNRANKMVALLGDFLRQTLDHSQEQMVTLEEELAFLRCYLAIEETRFEDRLSVQFDIDPSILDAFVPHMIMQPLVENAVKHGIAPFAAPGQILVEAQRKGDELVLAVHDSGAGAPNPESLTTGPSDGVGMANVRSRLICIYGDAARVVSQTASVDGYRVELTIPLSRDLSTMPKVAPVQDDDCH